MKQQILVFALSAKMSCDEFSNGRFLQAFLLFLGPSLHVVFFRSYLFPILHLHRPACSVDLWRVAARKSRQFCSSAFEHWFVGFGDSAGQQG